MIEGKSRRKLLLGINYRLHGKTALWGLTSPYYRRCYILIGIKITRKAHPFIRSTQEADRIPYLSFHTLPRKNIHSELMFVSKFTTLLLPSNWKKKGHWKRGLSPYRHPLFFTVFFRPPCKAGRAIYKIIRDISSVRPLFDSWMDVPYTTFLWTYSKILIWNFLQRKLWQRSQDK